MKNSILFVVFFVLSSPLSLLGQTDFTASKLAGCDTLTVKFVYTTSLVVSNVYWTFGDGSSSPSISPEHKYAQPGKYLVSVKLNNTDSVGKADYINIGKTPIAGFSIRDTLGITDRTMVFDANPQSASPFSYTYNWTISDGSTGNTAYFYHQFDTTGNYTAKLIIQDTQGCKDSTIQSFEVQNKLDVPSVFTPNNDGSNDLFIVEGDNKTTYSFEVFTPSGVKVYQSATKVIVWDGRSFSGSEVSPGVYYYVIYSKDGSSSVKQTGFFYLYR